MRTVFFRALEAEDKADALLRAIRNPSDLIRFEVDPANFSDVPRSPFAYWLSSKLRELFVRMGRMESDSRIVRQGGPTGDDARYLRLATEVTSRDHTMSNWGWVPFAKGGSLSRWYSDFPLVVVWDYQRGTFGGYTGLLHRSSERPSSAGHYFKAGLTWPLRAASFAPVPLPAQSIFSVRGAALIAPQDQLLALGAIGNSAVFDYLYKVALGRFGFPEFGVGVLQSLPFPELGAAVITQLTKLAARAWSLKRALDTGIETSHAFVLPALLQVEGDTLVGRAEAWNDRIRTTDKELKEIQRQIDNLCYELYGIERDERLSIEGFVNPEVTDGDGQDNTEENEAADKEANVAPMVASLLSWSFGIAQGRFDVRLTTSDGVMPPEPGPFDPLPVCSPGMLIGPDELPARPNRIVSEEWLKARPNAPTLHQMGSVTRTTIPDSTYPLRIAWDGILVDDSDHQADIVQWVRWVLEFLWGDSAEAIENEACEVLGVQSLREYFRNPKHFWDDHVKRYSKSSRKAPNYWLLQSPHRHYALWLYYHRLDRDMLYKALRNHVDPKHRLEESRLGELRDQLPSTPEGRDRKALEKQIDDQDVIVNDVLDFKERLEKVAALGLDPDLNDGVVLNIAPLHELVPWKEPKKYWDELLAGKYEWSTIGKQLRERGLVRG